MNQPVCCITPIERAISYELIPFFALAISQNPQIHLSKEMGLSSKTVPTRIVNCFLVAQCLHVQSFRVEIKLTSVDPQRGN